MGRWFWWPQMVRQRPARGVVAQSLARSNA
jgi:RND superfamily putative drug exporter